MANQTTIDLALVVRYLVKFGCRLVQSNRRYRKRTASRPKQKAPKVTFVTPPLACHPGINELKQCRNRHKGKQASNCPPSFDFDAALQLMQESLRLLSSDNDNGKRTCTVLASFITQSTHACIFSRLDVHDQRRKKQLSQAATRQQQQAASTAATVPQLKNLFSFGKDISTLPQKGCGFLCTS